VKIGGAAVPQCLHTSHHCCVYTTFWKNDERLLQENQKYFNRIVRKSRVPDKRA